MAGRRTSRTIQERWDRRYKEKSPFMGLTDAHPWLTEHESLLEGGVALEIACGQARDTIWLARHGYRVIATDISRRALREAHRRAGAAGVLDRILFVLSDVREIAFPLACFDLLVGFSFWEREKTLAMKTWIKPGGLIIYETFNEAWCNFRPDMDPKHMLHAGELAQWLAGWEIIDQREIAHWRESDRGKAVSSIVGRKILPETEA